MSNLDYHLQVVKILLNAYKMMDEPNLLCVCVLVFCKEKKISRKKKRVFHEIVDIYM